MMTDKELTEYKTPCQYIHGKLIPCVVVISHQEANTEIAECQRKANDTSVELMLALDERNKLRAEVERLTKLRGSAWALAGLVRTKKPEFHKQAVSEITSLIIKAVEMVEQDLAALNGEKEE